MAIQLPNPGLGDGQTGDNEYVMWTKVKNNFDNSDHAASRLVGEKAGNVMRVGAFGVGGTRGIKVTDLEDNIGKNSFFFYTYSTPNAPSAPGGMGVNMQHSDTNLLRIFGEVTSGDPDLYFQGRTSLGWKTANKVYHNNNTDEHGTNGYLKPSSPILKIESERMWGNNNSDSMGATYTKKGVGHYEIAGTTGLRNDGWYAEIPNDLNGNPKVAIGTLDDTDGVITLKTYVRTFDMTTFKFEPDLEQPLDIPEGRWIDLRFNDLPDEDDTQTEV